MRMKFGVRFVKVQGELLLMSLVRRVQEEVVSGVAKQEKEILQQIHLAQSVMAVALVGVLLGSNRWIVRHVGEQESIMIA